MIDKLRDSIEQLSEREAKTWLYLAVVRLEQLQLANAAKEEILEEICNLRQELEFITHPPPIQRECSTVHIVCGESAAGSLKVGLERDNRIIGYPEFFSIGPLWQLHTDKGRKDRFEWLQDHINFGFDYMEKEHEKKIAASLTELQTIPDHLPIVLWSAENAEEQIFLRYMLQVLRDKPNDIYLINTTFAYRDLFYTTKTNYYPHYTAEAVPEKLKEIFEKQRIKQLSADEKKQWQSEWLELSKKEDVLRIWEDKKIKSIAENHFDDLIIRCAETIQSKRRRNEFIKAGRIIGEVCDQLAGHISSFYFEYRLRSLIYNGVFEIKGVPKEMRNYSVRLKVREKKGE